MLDRFTRLLKVKLLLSFLLRSNARELNSTHKDGNYIIYPEKYGLTNPQSTKLLNVHTESKCKMQ